MGNMKLQKLSDKNVRTKLIHRVSRLVGGANNGHTGPVHHHRGEVEFGDVSAPIPFSADAHGRPCALTG
jgi:hypothetical protein